MGCLDRKRTHRGDSVSYCTHKPPAYDWLREHPEAASYFNQANARKAAASYPAILQACDFSKYNSFTDIGGGYGIPALEILKQYPHIKGTIADLPPVLAKAREIIPPELLRDRCSLTECDFFTGIPTGSDIYIMAQVLHNWDDEKCRIIPGHCREAMKPDTPLLLLEMIILPGNNSSTSKFMDLEVYVMGGGKERTEKEIRDLVTSAGLRVNRIMRTESEYSLIESVGRDYFIV